jgi:D-alanyl-D-alanine carboxypeptidase
MISTVDDLLAYGRALGTGEGQLSAAQQDKRLGSFVSDVPPLNEPPLKGDLAYGLGLMNIQGWIGHTGNIAGYNTYLFYHPDLEAVVAVEVNTNIQSGDCPQDEPSFDVEEDIICAAPADRVFRALAEALGQPAPAPGPVVVSP